METILILIVVALVVFLVIGGVFAIALARSAKKQLAASASIPGIDIAVPASWAGSHDPEARLHRRIRDALAALDATAGRSGAAEIDDRARLFVSASELDERLVAIWSLPANAKPGPLAEVERGVQALESGAQTVALSSGDGAVGRAEATAEHIDRFSRPAPAAPPNLPPVAEPPATDPPATGRAAAPRSTDDSPEPPLPS